MAVIYIVVSMTAVFAGWAYWYTVWCQKEDWSLGAIRSGAFLAAAVTAWFQAWYWLAVCVVILILSLFSGKPESSEPSKGGDVVDNNSPR